jgi:hypothetical protein
MYRVETVHRELDHFPRGSRGSPQNYFRAIFWAVRAHGLGRRATIPPTFDAALGLATRLIRQHFPDFVPTVAYFFRSK